MHRTKNIVHSVEILLDEPLQVENLRKCVKSDLTAWIAGKLADQLEFTSTINLQRGTNIITARLKVIEPDPKLTIENAMPDTKKRRNISMVSFDICGGNPGALQFLMTAYDIDMFKAETAFQRMQDNRITGTKLYMFWNDCCGRDTKLAMRIMADAPIDKIVEHINYEGGRGYPFTEEELAAIC